MRVWLRLLLFISIRMLGYIWRFVNKRHVFVSYHHQNDQEYREEFERMFADKIYISTSVQMGDIDPSLKKDTIRQKIRDKYLRTSNVTIVLIGEETWKRKFIDWEISSSIRDTKHHKRSGLIGIVLPTHPNYNDEEYDVGIVPPRLVYNHECDYASIYKWSSLNSASLTGWIKKAYKIRDRIEPDNSYPHFVNNKSGEGWTEEVDNWLGYGKNTPQDELDDSVKPFDEWWEQVGGFVKRNAVGKLAYITIGLGIPLALFGYWFYLTILLVTAGFTVCLNALLPTAEYIFRRWIGIDDVSDTVKLVFITITLSILLIPSGYWFTLIIPLVIAGFIVWWNLR